MILRAAKTALGLAFAGTVLATPLYADTEPVRESIRERVELLRGWHEVRVGAAALSSFVVLPRLYERHDFWPLWANPASVDQLFEVVARARRDGLEPLDYHSIELERLRAAVRAIDADDPALVASFDLLLTDSLVRLLHHMRFGKVDPATIDAEWSFVTEIDELEEREDTDPVHAIEHAIEAATIGALIDEARPKQPFYATLREALAHYQSIAEAGGVGTVPPGPPLKKGMEGLRVAALRRSLLVRGDLGSAPEAATLFDTDLEEAVKKFQVRHRLDADGNVGDATIAMLNAPAEKWIDRIRINLERARWVRYVLTGDFVLVDIAGFRASYLRDGVQVWDGRAQVGRLHRKTPVLRGQMKYLVINPTWTVPPGMLRQDVLPRLKSEPEYLAVRNMEVIDQQGNRVDQSTLDWSLYPEEPFPYLIRQEPGPNNALGRIKFIFPNDQRVYLHDTPSKELFDRADRAFRSGCIRIESPFELAELLLEDKPGWGHDRFEQALASERPETVFLAEPVTVLILYWTVDVGRDQTIVFKQDVYDRDAAVLAELDSRYGFGNGRPAPSPLR